MPHADVMLESTSGSAGDIPGLLPCPFCGCAKQKEIVVEHYQGSNGLKARAWLQCYTCEASGPVAATVGPYDERRPEQIADAAEAWNSRTNLSSCASLKPYR